MGQNATQNSICLPEASKVIDRQLNEYAMLMGWGTSNRLSLGYAKINYDSDDNDIEDTIKDVVFTKKLDNIKLCQVIIIKFEYKIFRTFSIFFLFPNLLGRFWFTSLAVP